MAATAPDVTAEIYRLLNESIEPQQRRKMIEEIIFHALHGADIPQGRSFEERLSRLEQWAHEPFDFTDLINRLERLEGSALAAGAASTEARRPSGAPSGAKPRSGDSVRTR